MPGIAPVVEQNANAAIESGDPSKMMAVAPLAAGTPVAPALAGAAANAVAKTIPIQATLDVVNANGGVGTAKGRLTAADSIASFAPQQPETSFWRGLGLGLMGDKNWRNAATEGTITPVTQIGRNGDSVTAFMPENSKRPKYVLNNKTNEYLTADQYAQGGYGTYSNMESTPGYKADIASTTAATDNYLKQLEAANRASIVLDTIHSTNQKLIKPNAKALERTGLSSADINELFKYSTTNSSVRNSISSGVQSLRQANDTTSYNNSIDQARSSGVSVSLPKIIGTNADGSYKYDDGKSHSINDLESMAKQASSSESIEKQNSQSWEQRVQNAVYQKLDFKQKLMFDNMLNAIQSNEKLKATHQDALEKLPVVSPTIPFHVGQATPVAIANTFVDEANARAVALYRNRLAEAGQHGAIPDLGAINGSMSIGENKTILDEIRSNAAKNIDLIQSTSIEPASQASTAEAPLAAKQIAEPTVKAKKGGVPPPKVEVKPAVAVPPRLEQVNPASAAVSAKEAENKAKPSIEDLLKKHTK